MEEKLRNLIEIHVTEKNRTFLLHFNWGKFYLLDLELGRLGGLNLYYEISSNFVEETRQLGLSTAKLRKKYMIPDRRYYITFRSVHDAMAFKLTWS